MTLAYIHIDAYRWPEADSNLQIRPLLINYCISGRSELLLEDGSYIYLTENGICISRQTAQNEYIFPAGHYEGDPDLFRIQSIYPLPVRRYWTRLALT